MRILQLCKKFPFPLKDGESVAVTYLSQALQKEGCSLTLLSMNTTKHYFDLSTLPADYDHYEAIHVVDIDNRIKLVDAFFNLFSSRSYHVERYISAEFAEKLRTLLLTQHFDVVQLETLYLAPYIETIRAVSAAKIVLRSHNVEYEIWKRMFEQTTAWAKRWYLGLLARRLKAFEVAHLNQYDLLAAITQRDLDFYRHLGCRIPACVVPIGLDTSKYEASETATEGTTLSCCFIGSLDWQPNTEGVRWLLDEVWHKVRARVPSATLHIAGRNTPEWLFDGHWQGVNVHGEVDDALTFIRAHNIMLVPLHAGGGMRVKILEGMSLGKPVVSTTIGIEGIAAVPNEEALVADTSDDFAASVVRLYEDAELLNNISQQARRFACLHYDNRRIARKLIEFYEQHLPKTQQQQIL